MPLSDASLPLQKAIVAALKADLFVATLVGTRIYDAVPMNATKPYVSFGPFQLLAEEGDCIEGGEIIVQLDAWAVGPDTVEVKRLGSAVAMALDNAPLALDENQRLVMLEIQNIQYLREPDGLTAHGVLTVRALTEPTA